MDAPAPTLELGPRRHDLRHRALVLAAPGADPAGADAVLVSSPDQIADAGADAGAAVAAGGLPAVLDGRGLDGIEPPAGVPLVVTPAERERVAARLGDRARIVVAPTDASSIEALAREGWVVLYDAELEPDDEGGAAYALAVARGCRALAAVDVRTARRVAAVVAAIGAAP